MRKSCCGAARLFGVALVLVFMVWLTGCEDTETVVGFLGPLEGKYSDLGVHGRNGVQLALEEANSRGGVSGKRFRLCAADDANSPERTVLAMRELINARAEIVIGPMISAVAEAALQEAEAHSVPLLSPTVSTPALSHRKDLFFRVLTENLQWSKALALHGRMHEQFATAVLVSDLDNEAYSEPFCSAFRQTFEQNGGRVLRTLEIHSASVSNWQGVADELASLRADVVVLSLAARDATMLAKTFASRGEHPRVYSAMWAATKVLSSDCGQDCAGWMFGMGYCENRQSDVYLAFRERYMRRFGYEPSFAAALSYEACEAYLETYNRTKGQRVAIPQALTKLTAFPGVIGTFSLDEFGDVIRDSYIVLFNGSEFLTHAIVE